jgi:hypothetical protein
LIPKEFFLAGIKVKVILDPTLHATRKIVGEARYPDQQILLDNKMLSGELLEQNFYHELIHWVLYVLNEDALRENEKLVDTIAYMLHQGLKTGNDFYTKEELAYASTKA